METLIVGPADFTFFGIPLVIFSFLIPVVGVGCFAYIMANRLAPIIKAAPDNRFNRIPERIFQLIKIWLLQWRQPRYMKAGIIHIVIFFGFLVLSIRSTELVIIGISNDFKMPGFGGFLGAIYSFFKDYAATGVLIACIFAAVRRIRKAEPRFNVPEKFDHSREAIFVLGLISTLMIAESLYEASHLAATGHNVPAIFSLVWFETIVLSVFPVGALQAIHILAYYVHDVVFFFFLCFLPMGKHFHVITSFFNVLFMRLDRGNIKPVRYDVSDEQLDDLESFGVKKLEDFTWKHILDFYSCADCGRCSDQCPANLVGRPLSPRFISIKAREKLFENYPLRGEFAESKPVMGDIFEEDEIWSCTTCGACEQECPLGIEYIDKIVDLRRGMVDEGMVPQTLQKPLSALEKRGNAWGKMEKKRADWTKAEGFAETCRVKLMEEGETADTLYFVDSISSYDDRMQDLARATARVLAAGGTDFCILGKDEKDSGNEVRRFGEEMLFQSLKDHNIDMILESGVKHIITADPHAYNAIKNDYHNDKLPSIEHLSQYVARKIKSGEITLKPVEDGSKVYTYHDPCYLGRHNSIYDAPREAMDAIPGLRRVEMAKYRDRSLCCSGGGLMLFYEPEEEERMGVIRVKMAAEAGANVIVTACPFCLVNIEDAIKVAKMDDTMEAIDFSELIARHLEG